MERGTSKGKVVEETWDDDFVFEEKPTGKLLATDEDKYSVDVDLWIDPLNSRLPRNSIYYEDDPDVIPNVGFADFFEDQFSSSLNSIEAFPSISEASRSPFLNDDSGTDCEDIKPDSFRRRASPQISLSVSRESPFDGNMSNQSMAMFGGSQTGDKASSVRVVSFDEGDNEFDDECDEEDEEDDWDAELVNEQKNNFNNDVDHTPIGLGTSNIYSQNENFTIGANPLDNPFSIGAALPIGTNEHRKENLLEYLENVIQSTLQTDFVNNSNAIGLAGVLEDATTGLGAAPGKMAASSTLRAYFCSEETRALESANQHLKGLFSWIESSTTNLKSVLTEKNCNEQVNARQLLESEIQFLQRDDLFFIERLLTRCEENPMSESCVYSLEVIIKWIRAVCNIYDEVHKSSNFVTQPTEISGGSTPVAHNQKQEEKRTIPSSSGSTADAVSNNPKNLPTTPSGNEEEDLLRNITYEKIDVIFRRCDYILVEQSKSLCGRIEESYSIMEKEFNSTEALDSSEIRRLITWEDTGVLDSKTLLNGIVNKVMQVLSNQINVFRIESHMLDIKTHINNNNKRRISQGYDLFLTLKNLQSLIDQLDKVLNKWLRMLYYFLPQVGILDIDTIPLSSQCFDSPSDIRIARLRSRLLSQAGLSQYTQYHVEVLLKIVIDLQALCVANKLFVISAVSPISLQERDIYTSTSALNMPDSLEEPSTPPPVVNNSSKPKRSHYFPNLMRRKEDKQLAIEIEKAKRNSFVKKLPFYDISYEAAIGSQFISLMTLIPSPSIARSKLSFAAYCYLQRLKNDELPWQQAGRFQIYDPDSAQSPDRVNSKEGVKILSIEVVENGIADSFSEAFGSLDESRILQLLLYEAAVDLYPVNTKVKGKDPPSPSTKHKRTAFRKDVFHFSNKDTSTIESDLTDSSLRHIFSHVPFAMNLSHSLLECMKDFKDFGTVRTAAGVLSREISGSSYTSSRVTSIHSKHSSWGGYFGNDDFELPSTPTSAKNSFPQADFSKFIPSRAKNKSISFSLRYELYNLSFEILSNLAKCVIDTCPSAALGLYNICAILLAHMKKPQERLEYHRDAAVLAVKLEKHDEAIMHGKYVMNNLLATKTVMLDWSQAGGMNGSPMSASSYSSPGSSIKGSPNSMSTRASNNSVYAISTSSIAIATTDQDINELMYVTELLASEYCENSQQEMAIKTIVNTLYFINKTTPIATSTPRSPNKSSRSMSSMTDNQSQFDRVVYPLMLKLGSIFFEMGCAMKAADTYQVLLVMLTERIDCVANDEKKVAVLSWIVECYLEMNDCETATKMLKTIKEVRKVKIDKYTTPVAITSPTVNTATNSNTNTSGIALDRNSKHVSNQQRFSGSVTEEAVESVGPSSSDREFLAQNRYSPSRNASLLNQRKLFPLSRGSSLQRDGINATSSANLASPPRITSKKLFFAESPGMKLRYHLNSKESNLPKHCITTYNTDLGDLTSRIYFRNKQFISALKSLTPTIIGVELMVGGKSNSNSKKDSLVELGKLYYLRGKIQLEASKASNIVKFPFEVGSVQLFSAIQLISSDVKKSRVSSTTVRKQFSRGGISAAPPSLHSSESFVSTSGHAMSRSDSMQTSGESSGHGSTLHGKPSFYSGTNNMLSCKRTITYNNPSDLLWDAMKWFRRSWDLFHAAGDELSAAKSANYIAKCHLTPSFVPTAFFDIPLEKSCNLSSIVVESVNDDLSVSNTNLNSSGIMEGHKDGTPPEVTPRSSSVVSMGSEFKDSPKNSPRNVRSEKPKPKYAKKRPEPLSIEDNNTSGIPAEMMRVSSLSTKSLSSVLFAHLKTESVDETSAPLSIRSHSTSSGLLQTEISRPESQNLTNLETDHNKLTHSPKLKSNILLRRASLDEVYRVMQFALDTSIECCLPLLMIDTYLNLAELYTLQGNKTDGSAYWEEAKELFLHLFVDGCLVPILRRASMQFAQKLFELYCRLVRFLWTCDRTVVNRNLFLVDLQLLFSTEIERINRKMKCFARLSGKSLDLVLKQLKTAPSLPTVPERPERRTLSSRFKTGSLRSMMGISNLTINVEVPQQHVLLSPGLVDQFLKRHYSGDESQMQLSDKDYYRAINKGMTDRRLYDFGWKQYLDYETLLKEALAVNHRENEVNIGRNMQDEKRTRSLSVGNNPVKRKSLSRKLSSFAWMPSPESKSRVSKMKSMEDMKSSGNTSVISSNKVLFELQYVRQVLLSLFKSYKKYDTIPKALHKYILQKEDISAEGLEEVVEDTSLTPRSNDATLNSKETSSTSSTFGESKLEESKTPSKKGLRRKSINLVKLNNDSSDSQESSSSHSTVVDAASSNNNSSSNIISSPKTIPLIKKSSMYRVNKYRALDPYIDFEWMDESYSAYYTEPLLYSATSSSESSLDSDFFDCDDNVWDGSSLSVEFLNEVEANSENILIQRLWRCFLVIKNSQSNYQSRKHSMEVLRHSVRNSLRNLTLFMYRLRAFSKQYKGKMTSYDELVAKVSHDHEEFGDMRYIGKSDSSDGSSTIRVEEDPSSRAVGLMHRLPHLVYTVHINNLLMCYRPYDGTRHIQLFGGNGFLVYSTVEKAKRLSNRRIDRMSSNATSSFFRPTSDGKLVSTNSFVLPFVSYSGDVDDNVNSGGVMIDALKNKGMRSISDDEVENSNKANRRPPLVGQKSNNSIRMMSPKPSGNIDSPTAHSTNVKKITSFDGSLACSSDSYDNTAALSIKPSFRLSVPPRSGSTLNSIAEAKSVEAKSSQSQMDMKVTEGKPASPTHKEKFRRKDSLISTISFLSFHGGNGISRFGSTDSFFRTERLKSFQSTNTLVEAVANGRDGHSGSPMNHHSTVFEPSMIVNLSIEEISLLIDLSVQDTNHACGGGLVTRRALFESMKSGVLCNILEYLRSVAVPLPSDIVGLRPNSVSKDNTNSNNNNSSITEPTVHENSDMRHHTASTLSSYIPTNWQWRKSGSLSTNNSGSTGSAPHGLSKISNSTDTTQEVKLSPINYSSVVGKSSLELQCESDDSDLFSGHHAKAPLRGIPLTILSSRSLNVLPWEILLNKENVIRSMSLISLCCQHFSRRGSFSSLSEQARERTVSLTPTGISKVPQLNIPPLHLAEAGKPPLPSPKVLVKEKIMMDLKFKGFLGPGWNQKPVFVANSNSELGDLMLPSEVAKSVDVNRRAKSAVNAVQSLLHRSDAIVSNSYYKSFLVDPQLSHYQMKNTERIINSYLFPVTSPLISSSHLSPSALKSANHLELTIVELHADYDKSLDNYVAALDRKLTTMKTSSNDNLSDPEFMNSKCPEESPFPIIFLTYTDLIEASDAMHYLSSRRFDAVFIFAPHFIIESVAVEVKIALNRWCRPTMKLSQVNLKRSKSSSNGLVNTLKRFSSSISSFGVNSAATSVLSTETMKLSEVQESTSEKHTSSRSPSASFSERRGFKSTSKSKSFFSRSMYSNNSKQPVVGVKNKGHNKSFGDKPSSAHSLLNNGSMKRSVSSPVGSTGSSKQSNRPSFLKRSSGSTDVEVESETDSSINNSKDSLKIKLPSENVVGSSAQSKTIRAKDRTWVYHALLDVVTRLQEEHAVPIAIFI